MSILPRTVHNVRMKSIGARVRAARETEGLTQLELARLIGITQGALSKYEAGKLDSAVTLALIREALDCSWSELLGPDDA